LVLSRSGFQVTYSREVRNFDWPSVYGIGSFSQGTVQVYGQVSSLRTHGATTCLGVISRLVRDKPNGKSTLSMRKPKSADRSRPHALTFTERHDPLERVDPFLSRSVLAIPVLTPVDVTPDLR